MNTLGEAAASLQRLWARMHFVVGRGRISLVDDSGAVQFVQIVLSPKETPDLRRVVEFGLASNPPAGTDGIAVFIAGDRSNGVVIATNNQQLRPKGLQPGEVMVYDGNGQSVYLSKTGIVVNGGGNPINVNNAPQVNINGAETVKVQAGTDVEFDTPLLKCTGDIIDNSGTNTSTMADMREVYDGHDHDVVGVATGDSTITTNAPNQTE